MSKERRGEVSDIDKTIERVKKAESYLMRKNYKWSVGDMLHLSISTDIQFIVESANSVMPIITAYEESQRNVVHKNELLDWLQGEHNKANAELLAALKNIELDAHGGVTYGKMEKALIRIAASAQEAYNKHKGE